MSTSGIFKEIDPYLDQFNASIAQLAEADHGKVVPLYLTMNGPKADLVRKPGYEK
jgi:hypothetical protein